MGMSRVVVSSRYIFRAVWELYRSDLGFVFPRTLIGSVSDPDVAASSNGKWISFIQLVYPKPITVASQVSGAVGVRWCLAQGQLDT